MITVPGPDARNVIAARSPRSGCTYPFAPPMARANGEVGVSGTGGTAQAGQPADPNAMVTGPANDPVAPAVSTVRAKYHQVSPLLVADVSVNDVAGDATVPSRDGPHPAHVARQTS